MRGRFQSTSRASFGLSIALAVASSNASAFDFLTTDGTKLFRGDFNGTVSSPVTLSSGIQSLTTLGEGVSLAGASEGDIIALGTSATAGRWKMFRLDDPNGTPTLVQIGSLNHGVGSLVFANGKMYGVDDTLNALRVYEFNPANGNATTTFNTGIAAGGGGGLAFNPNSGLFYLTDATNNRLYSWTPGNAATLVGPLGLGISNNGLEFHNGRLYASVRPDSAVNTLRVGTVDINTGTFSSFATATGVSGNGTGFVVVPEAGTVVALGLGLVCLRKRRA